MLHQKSQELVKEIMKVYKDGGGTIPNHLRGTTLVHIYSAHDTMEPDGTLNGYYQNLFFKMVVFNIDGEKYTKWAPERFYDAIFIDPGVRVENITVFKDGATCVKLPENLNFLDGQACTFYKE